VNKLLSKEQAKASLREEPKHDINIGTRQENIIFFQPAPNRQVKIKKFIIKILISFQDTALKKAKEQKTGYSYLSK